MIDRNSDPVSIETMKELLEENSLILMEAAIVETLRRSKNIELHPVLVNAPLVYEEAGRQALAALYQTYIDIASAAHKPFLMCTPTWRANYSRVVETGIRSSVNVDAALFLKGIRDSQESGFHDIRIGGLIGCKNDCYLPEQALSAAEAEDFHSWQLEQLKEGGVDFVIAETLPSVEEAIGIARAIESTGLPYFMSFVISRDGLVLDGTPLDAAILTIDEHTSNRPLGYMVNCAYPSFLNAARQPAVLFERLVGYLANASSLDHCDLDGSDDLKMESVVEWGDLMLQLNRDYGVKVLGGCCGTNQAHLDYLVDGAN